MEVFEQDWHRSVGERLRLRELRILHAVTRHGSMARAAASLGMTQPAVSQAIALLESALGVPLIERGPTGAAATEYGETLLRHAREAAHALSDGVREVAAMADPASGAIAVGASESYIAGGVLARTIMTITQLFPRMRIDVVESNTAAMDFADLRERRVDVMLGRVAKAPLPDDLTPHVLMEEPLAIVAGGQHAWAHDPALGLAQLAARPWVLAPAGSAVHALVAAAFNGAGVAMPTAHVTTWSMTLRLQLLSTGDYVTAFPVSLVHDNRDRWNLRILPPRLGSGLPVAAFTLKSRVGNRAIAAFLNAARDQSAAMAAELEKGG